MRAAEGLIACNVAYEIVKNNDQGHKRKQDYEGDYGNVLVTQAFPASTFSMHIRDKSGVF